MYSKKGSKNVCPHETKEAAVCTFREAYPSSKCSESSCLWEKYHVSLYSNKHHQHDLQSVQVERSMPTTIPLQDRMWMSPRGVWASEAQTRFTPTLISMPASVSPSKIRLCAFLSIMFTASNFPGLPLTNACQYGECVRGFHWASCLYASLSFPRKHSLSPPAALPLCSSYLLIYIFHR